MSQENEPKEKKEKYPGSPMIQTSTEEGPLEAHKNTKEIPYQVFKIVQNFYTSAILSQDELSQPPQERLGKRIIHICNEIGNMSTKRLEKLIKIVKDYSVTESQPWEIIDFLQALKALSIDQWETILEKVKIAQETELEYSTEDKLSEILGRVRTMKNEEFEKLKSLIMGCPSFRTEAEKLNLVELLTKVRSMPEKKFIVLKGMVKDSSVTPKIKLIKEMENTWKQLRQLTIEQVDEVLEMVENLSVI